jgi:excisionase family DNA binding protein
MSAQPQTATQAPPPPPDDDLVPAVADAIRLYDLTDAAAMLGGVSQRYVYQLIYDGVLRKVKQGRRTFVRGDDIAAYIDAHTVDDAS